MFFKVQLIITIIPILDEINQLIQSSNKHKQSNTIAQCVPRKSDYYQRHNANPFSTDEQPIQSTDMHNLWLQFVISELYVKITSKYELLTDRIIIFGCINPTRSHAERN